MAGYERMMMAKIQELEKKVITAKRYCETEEEAHRNNVDFSTDNGYIYYNKQLQLIPERREASLALVNRKKDTFTAQKETAISKLKADVELFKRKMEQKESEIAMLEALIENNNNLVQKELQEIHSKYESQVGEYIQKAKDIKDALSYPTGRMYLKNRELIGILEREIATTRNGMDEIMNQERLRKRADAIAQSNRELAEAERKEKEERLEALRILSQERIAIQEKKEARWKLLRQERELENLEELEKLKLEK
jgi:hypothetical protein